LRDSRQRIATLNLSSTLISRRLRSDCYLLLRRRCVLSLNTRRVGHSLAQGAHRHRRGFSQYFDIGLGNRICDLAINRCWQCHTESSVNLCGGRLPFVLMTGEVPFCESQVFFFQANDNCTSHPNCSSVLRLPAASTGTVYRPTIH